MANLIYLAIAALDGYVEDEHGRFDWAEPDEEVHAFVNDLERTVSTHLYGRRMYEVMCAWETMSPAAQPPAIQDFAQIWRAAEKVVYSTTLAKATTAKTRIERSFDPEAVRRIKASADHDATVGGPRIAARAFEAGLVDECRLFLAPVAVGGGKRALPEGFQLQLELLDERRFASGVVYLHYRVRA